MSPSKVATKKTTSRSKGNLVTISGETVAPGESRSVHLPLPQLYTYTPLEMPVHVVNGKRAGPKLFVCAAMHGDELNGVEIIRRLLGRKILRELRGTLIAVPIVNIYGVIERSRYLPDRRDLNRCFPGSPSGSLAGRLAHLFMQEIVANSTHGIDLHTGAIHRSNVPQIRADLSNPENKRLAEAFGVPVILNARVRDGSLRAELDVQGMPAVLYEAGEALRFDEVSIRAGVRGVLNIMRALDMLPPLKTKTKTVEPFVASTKSWARAPVSGIVSKLRGLGQSVAKGDTIGEISDPFRNTQTILTSPASGVVIGRTNLPLVNEGDAILHIAEFADSDAVTGQVQELEETYPQNF